MSLNTLMEQLKHSADSVEFEQVMAVIAEHFDYSPTRFSNGPGLINEAGTNEGSCKIFALGQLLQLSPEQTLACFGKFYREHVLQHPEATDHANIRTFIAHGWDGIKFDGQALFKR